MTDDERATAMAALAMKLATYGRSDITATVLKDMLRDADPDESVEGFCERLQAAVRGAWKPVLAEARAQLAAALASECAARAGWPAEPGEAIRLVPGPTRFQ